MTTHFPEGTPTTRVRAAVPIVLFVDPSRLSILWGGYPPEGLKPARLSLESGLFWSWANSPVVARCSAQVLAPDARSSLHVSAGTPTAARSLLCTVRILLIKSAVFSVLLFAVGVVVVVPPPVDDEPLLSVVDEPSLLSSVCPLAYIIAEVGKTIEITIKTINEIVIIL
jgi:hypothetical protein